MKSFRDTAGRTWDVAGSLGAFERVKTSAGVDLLTLPTTQACLQKMADPFTLGRVLYELCAGQCESRGITPEQFAEGFNADALTEALDAVVQEVIFFCRKEMQPALMKIWNKAKDADRQALAAVAMAANQAADRMDAETEKLLASIGSATSSAASSASTPGRGRSAASSGRPRRGNARRGITLPT